VKKTFVLLFLTAVFVQGCLSRKRIIPPDQRLLPAQTMSRIDLLKKLDERSKAIQKMTATVTLDASGGSLKTGVLTEYRQSRGIIVVERPSHLRLRVQAPLALATVADMVSDGMQYRVSVPIRNKFIIGDANAPATSDNLLSNLRPNHLMAGMFIDTTVYSANPQVHAVLEEAIQGQRSYYVVHFINTSTPEAQLLEKIWVDRSTLEVARKQIFKGDGKLETNVEFSAYMTIQNIQFPTLIDIQRPIEDY